MRMSCFIRFCRRYLGLSRDWAEYLWEASLGDVDEALSLYVETVW